MSTDVTPLYDQEIESLVWDDSEAKCEAPDCKGAATTRAVTPQCGHTICDLHAGRTRAAVAHALSLGATITCAYPGCEGGKPFSARLVRFVAI